MTAPAPLPESVLDLIDHLRGNAHARARQVAALLDVYLHTLPPPERRIELNKLIGIWQRHHTLWCARMDASVALEPERALTSFDWSETEAALTALMRDMEERRHA